MIRYTLQIFFKSSKREIMRLALSSSKYPVYFRSSSKCMEMLFCLMESSFSSCICFKMEHYMEQVAFCLVGFYDFMVEGVRLWANSICCSWRDFLNMSQMRQETNMERMKSMNDKFIINLHKILQAQQALTYTKYSALNTNIQNKTLHSTPQNNQSPPQSPNMINHFQKIRYNACVYVQKPYIMIILIALLILIGSSHLIISVTQTNPTVSTSQNITIKILTSTNIRSNTLTINLPPEIQTNQPCQVNNTTSNCTYTLSTTSRSIVFNNAFGGSTFYDLVINVRNPAYANNFQFTVVAEVVFSNSGVIGVVPKVIVCSLVPGSQVVGEITAGYFTINNDIIPNNSIITINSTIQSTFNPLIAPSPTCLIQNTTIPCSLTTNLEQQYLTINPTITNAGMTIQVNFINNPPFNDTFHEIGIQIQNSGGNYMQVCNFKQQGVSVLRRSSSFGLANWDEEIGAQSSVTATLNTFFTPYSNQLIFVYPANWIFTLQTPSSSVLFGNSQLSTNFITGTTIIGKSLTFSTIIKNPPFVQPLNSTIYIVYSSTKFIQEFTITSPTLKPITLAPLSLSLNQTRTSLSSIYNVSVVMPFAFSTGFVGVISVGFGVMICGGLGMTGNYVDRVVNCTDGEVFIESGDAVLRGVLWLSFMARNHHSTRTNQLTLTLFGPSPNFYRIGTGSTPIPLIPNNQPFTLINSNPIFYSQTTLTLTESPLSPIISSLNRIITLSLPIDLILHLNTTITNLRNDSVINSFKIDVGLSRVVMDVNGLLGVRVGNLFNPIKYNGSLLVNVSSTDGNNFPSSWSNTTMTPLYTSTTFNVNMTLSDTTIQNNATMVLTLIPTLQYYNPPTITITLSNSFILTPCSTCTAISSNIITLLYFAPIMRITISIKNNQHPFDNTIETTISHGTFIYETNILTYVLTPLIYTYTVSQEGLYGTIGNIQIRIVKGPTQSVELEYGDIGVLINPTCITCTNTNISISGIVKYFQSTIITLRGSRNNITYATANVQIKYVCQSITDCQICINQTNTNKDITLLCQQCYNRTFTVNNLLFNNKCVQTCPISTYSNGLTCVPCRQLCYICDAQTCKQCLPSYYVYNNTCLGTCPGALVNNATHCISVPIKCPNNCIDCPADNQCRACDASYVLLRDLCYSSCPSGYVILGGGCVQFRPPEETKYFPFPFLITACLVFIILISMKCFQKRSLIMGNLIAFVSIVQIGTIIMTLNYTLQSQSDLITQLLCYVLLFSKVMINLIFLIYFIKIIGMEEQFQRWIQDNESHGRVYKCLIVLSTLFSFQIIRIIYSRLLGLHIFFGKFNTSLIFKPLNNFTIIYFLTSGTSLITISLRNILAQNGYKTSIYFSSIQSIIIQIVLVVICFVDNKRGYDSQFFEYQIYKVYNQYEHSNIQQVEVEECGENGGSTHEMLNAILPIGSDIKVNGKGSALIRKNVFWAKKMPALEVSVQNVEVQMDAIQETGQNIQEINDEGVEINKQKLGIIENQKKKIRQQKNKQMLRQKMIEEWKNMQKSLPKKLNGSRRQNILQNKSNVPNQSFSPNQKNIKNALKRSSSMNEVELILPEEPVSIPEKIKKHFQSSMNNISLAHLLPKQKKKSKKQQKTRKIINGINGNNEIYKMQQQNAPNGITYKEAKSQHYSLENGSNNSQNQLLINQDYPYQDQQFQINNQKIFNSQVIRDFNENDHENMTRYRNGYNQELHQLEPDQAYYEHDIQEPSSSDEESKEIEMNGIDLNEVDMNEIHNYNSEKRFQNAEINTDNEPIQEQKKNGRGYVVNYRYEEGKEVEKQYRVKKRKVNRQTEKIYLERLLVSDNHKKSKQFKIKKIQF